MAVDLPDLARDFRRALHKLAAEIELCFEDGPKRCSSGPLGRTGLIIEHAIGHLLAVVDVPPCEFLRAIRIQELLAEIYNAAVRVLRE